MGVCAITGEVSNANANPMILILCIFIFLCLFVCLFVCLTDRMFTVKSTFHFHFLTQFNQPSLHLVERLAFDPAKHLSRDTENLCHFRWPPQRWQLVCDPGADLHLRAEGH